MRPSLYDSGLSVSGTKIEESTGVRRTNVKIKSSSNASITRPPKGGTVLFRRLWERTPQSDLVPNESCDLFEHVEARNIEVTISMLDS